MVCAGSSERKKQLLQLLAMSKHREMPPDMNAFHGSPHHVLTYRVLHV